jgi:hypothetical protein
MTDIIKFRKRISRKKREAKESKGYIVRDCRDAFLQVDHEYMNGYARLCSSTATNVYFMLCRRVGEDQVCWPANRDIGEHLGISEPTVRKAIRELEAHRIIKVDRAVGQPNIYMLMHKSQWRKFIPVEKVVGERKSHQLSQCGTCKNEGSEACGECIGMSRMEYR